MKTKKAVLTFFTGLLLANSLFAADTYAVDPGHSKVGFTVRHLVINKVEGIFKEFSGTMQFDEQDVTKSSVQGSIKAASIDTNNVKRDADLRSANFFDVEKYPEITFESKKVDKKGDDYIVTGILTMHGVSQEIHLPVTITGPIKDPWGNFRIGIEAKMDLNRRKYGLLYDNRLDSGGLVVGNEIGIHINAEAIKK